MQNIHPWTILYIPSEYLSYKVIILKILFVASLLVSCTQYYPCFINLFFPSYWAICLGYQRKWNSWSIASDPRSEQVFVQSLQLPIRGFLSMSQQGRKISSNFFLMFTFLCNNCNRYFGTSKTVVLNAFSKL